MLLTQSNGLNLVNTQTVCISSRADCYNLKFKMFSITDDCPSPFVLV